MWTKRNKFTSTYFSDIWDGDGWQINKILEPSKTPYLLVDAAMPQGVPASGVIGLYKTLKAAKAEAKKLGPSDWSDYDSTQ
jgi:hypothetical protein